MEWHPATVDEVKKIVRDDLAECDAEQLMAFKKYAVEPHVAPILRYGQMEKIGARRSGADELNSPVVPCRSMVVSGK